MKTKMLALITAALTVASPMAQAGSADYLLELDGIKGESKDERYSESIQILSWSWGCTNPGSSANVPTGTVVFSGLEISAPVSAASPQLLMACATGKRIPKAILHVRKAGTTQEYLTITMEDVMVSSWATGASDGTSVESATDGDPKPSESLSINFTKIEFKYTPFDSDAAPVTGTAEIAPR